MANKRYYWLRLKEDFFKSKEMKKLRRIAGGDTYTIIYLKMQLASIKNDGVLHYDGLEDAFYKELALDIDEDDENVKVAVAFLIRYGLLITQDDIDFSMPLVRECIGSETSSTIRSRRHRDKQKALQCNTCATLPSRRDRDRDRVREDKDIDEKKIATVSELHPTSSAQPEQKDKDTEKRSRTKPEDSGSVHLIIEKLNHVTGTNYKDSTEKTRRLIHARLKEGFTLKDFYTVIDKKAREWGDNADMVKYLRPETLFGTKFESYLNQPETISKPKDDYFAHGRLV